ncbi:hypothetical protein Tco_0889959 [Tanacetum coccineum]
MTMFRLQIRVQDENGTVSLTIWNDEVQAVVDRSAYQLCDKYRKETKATSSASQNATPLDLESQTDENTTPVNAQKTIAASLGEKRPAEEDITSDTNKDSGKRIDIPTKVDDALTFLASIFESGESSQQSKDEFDESILLDWLKLRLDGVVVVNPRDTSAPHQLSLSK